MSLIFKNMAFLNLILQHLLLYFHVINITYIKNYVILNLILKYYVSLCHLNKYMVFHKYFFISDLLTQLLNDES